MIQSTRQQMDRCFLPVQNRSLHRRTHWGTTNAVKQLLMELEEIVLALLDGCLGWCSHPRELRCGVAIFLSCAAV